jgi:hypothetical protein
MISHLFFLFSMIRPELVLLYGWKSLLDLVRNDCRNYDYSDSYCHDVSSFCIY